MAETLALHGGRPVRPALLPYGRHWVDDADVAAVVDSLKSGWVTTGPPVARFERAVAAQVGAARGVAVSSGTAALHAAMFAVGIGAGDEVIASPLTFAATTNAALYQGGVPIFADIDPDTLNLDPAEVERRLTSRTRAVVAVDYAGQPCDLAALRALTEARGVALIEDAAHALGARYRGRPLGALADLTTWSFHPVKHVTTGEGGMVTTDDPELADRCVRFRNHGITTDAAQREAAGDWVYEMVDLGFNYRLTDLQCALGLAQLGKLEGFLARREAIAARYREAFAGQGGLTLPAVAADVRHAWHLFPVLLDLERLGADRRTVFSALRAEGIGVNVHYIPVYWHPYYRGLGYEKGLCPRAEAAYQRLLSLPMFPAMDDRDVDDVVTAVRKVLGHYAR